MTLSDYDQSVVERASKIQLLILDVDGVLSDGKLYFSNSGDEIKTFSTLDGQGIKMLQNSGVQVAVITGRKSQIVERRCEALGIKYVIQGREDKLTALEELRKIMPVPYENIAHMGDDLPDLPIIKRVGLGMTVLNGHWVVKKDALWESKLKGGEGAVREACDFIMLSQGSLDHALNQYR